MLDAIEAAIVAIAGGQYRLITRQQLLGLGLSRGAIAKRLHNGRLHRVFPGVYALGAPPVTPLEWAMAAVLACGNGAVLSDRAALALWGFSKHWPSRMDVTVTVDRRPRGIIVHRRTLADEDRREQLGIPVTSPARTVLDCAPELPARQRVRTINDALHTPFLSKAQLFEAVARFPNHRGAPLVRAVLLGSDNPTRAGWEDDFPSFCEHFGLPEPRMSARVCGHEVDAYFAAERVIVELDGYEFHSDPEAFESDRDRDADTLAAGIATVRITWGRLKRRPRREADRLDAILRRRRLAA